MFSEHKSVNPQDMYSMTKNFCDQEFNIRCSCVKSDKLKDTPRGYFDNFLLKVNAKLGGLNTVANPNYLSCMPQLKLSQTMVVGVDVNHPGAHEMVLASISVAVGSYDELLTSYTASIRVQAKKGEEMVHKIDEMMTELLNEYFKINSSLPQNVIIFRDGVSEGQFSIVMNSEIPKIRHAIDQMNDGIKLSVIVVQKLHTTRFALTTQSTQWSRKPSYNVPSGTVVDTTM